MPRADHSFEALAAACGVDIKALTGSARGQLNKALAEIRAALPDLEDDELALMIEGKARAYRKVMGDAILTPTALAKHWSQLDALLEEHQKPTTYVSSDGIHCTTCDGHRMVLVRFRPVIPSVWALAHRSKKHPHMGQPHPTHRGDEDGFEEWGPCPDCNRKGVGIVDDHFARSQYHARRPTPPTPEAIAAMRKAVEAR